MNLTVNGAFTVWQMVDLYKRFTDMDGESPVANYIQNGIIAYVKKGTRKFSVYSNFATESHQADSKKKTKRKNR